MGYIVGIELSCMVVAVWFVGWLVSSSALGSCSAVWDGPVLGSVVGCLGGCVHLGHRLVGRGLGSTCVVLLLIGIELTGLVRSSRHPPVQGEARAVW